MTPSERLKELENCHWISGGDLEWLIARVKKLTEALEFYAGEKPNSIQWNPHVCDSYSGLNYAPDWNGDLQDEPYEIARKALDGE